jgi:hypothetical protein
MPDEQEAQRIQYIVLRRVRNRIIEYLELASSFDSQREYQSRTPVHVPDEIINQWEDWVQQPRDAVFESSVFSPDEQEAIAQFHQVWDAVATTTPKPLPNLEALFATADWRRLRDAALAGLRVFLVRGKLPEDGGETAGVD